MNTVVKFSAQFFDGISAKPLPAEVMISAGELEIILQDPDRTFRFPVSGIKIDTSSEESFSIQPSQDSDELLVIALKYKQLVDHAMKKKTKSRQKEIGFTLSIVALLVFGLYQQIPRIAAFGAKKIPIEWEKKIAGELETYVQKSSCDSKRFNAKLNPVIERFKREMGSKYEFKVFLTREASVNAFAMPGGIISVHTGFLRQTDSFEELAGVLAHEIQHVENRHIMKGVLRSSILGGLWSVLIGDFSSVLMVDPNFLYSIAMLKFTREDESEADRKGLEILTKSGISHKGFHAFFAKMDEKGMQIPEFLSSHPTSGERAKFARNLASEKFVDPKWIKERDLMLEECK